MKLCVDCGTEFKPQGRQKLCGACKDEERQLQKADEKEIPEQKAVRPLDRWRTNAAQPGCAGVRIINRGT